MIHCPSTETLARATRPVVEPLEHRRLLTYVPASVHVSIGGGLHVFATDFSDTIRVEVFLRDATKVVAWVNHSAPVVAYDIARITGVLVVCKRGDDKVDVDAALPFRTRILGGRGNDELNGGSADDVIRGDGGNDRIRGGAGNDVARGGRGHDDVDGGAGDDRVRGGRGRDAVTGGGGNDNVDDMENDHLAGTGKELLTAAPSPLVGREVPRASAGFSAGP
jgi:hypothetical protein